VQVILIQELFETPYFCKDHSSRHLELAKPLDAHPAVEHFRLWPRTCAWSCRSAYSTRQQCILQFSRHHRCRRDGARSYRKSHIPEGPGYHEKFYFSPGDTGFKVFDTRYASSRRDLLGPVVSGSGALHGADGRSDMLLYPPRSARNPGSGIDSSGHWQRTMQGMPRPHHAGDSLESHRQGAGRKVRHDLLRIIVHRLAHG